MRGHVYGCGFAGVVSALGLCQNGVEILGIDTNPLRISALTSSVPSSGDAFIDSLLKEFSPRRLTFSQFTDKTQSVDFCLLALGTPFDGADLYIDALVDCCISALKDTQFYAKPILIIRSTLPILGLQKIEQEILKRSQRTSGKDYLIFYMPEFMREGTGLDDWHNPPLNIIGINNGQPPEDILAKFSASPFIITTSNEVESVKLFSNAFHAMKVSFANEVFRICNPLGISAQEVMTYFCGDKKLNISEKYLTPGFAWGGGCLGKDLKGLRHHGSQISLLNSLEASNLEHIDFWADKILGEGIQKIGFYELNFKPNVSDTRNSPVFNLIEKLERSSQIEVIKIFKSSHVTLDMHAASSKLYIVEDLRELEDLDVVCVRSNKSFEYLTEQVPSIKLLKF